MTAQAPNLPAQDTATAPVIAVKDLSAWYGESLALDSVSFDLGRGEVLSLVGRNGAGKTTTLRAIMGLIPKRHGSVVISGQEVIAAPARTIARKGVALVPEERGIYSRLTVRENLVLPPVLRPGGWSLDRIFELFPNLRNRLSAPGTRLSGGEQQMLAIARVLRTGADIILLDEPTEGLAPVIVQQIERAIRLLMDDGFTILLVEQNLKFVTRIADRHVVIEEGRAVDLLSAEDVAARPGALKSYLGV